MLLGTRVVVGCLMVMIAAGTGCSSAPEEEDDASGEAISGGNEDFEEDDILVTTGALNLREEPSMQGHIIAVMPKGSHVTVTNAASSAIGNTPILEDLSELDSKGDDSSMSDAFEALLAELKPYFERMSEPPKSNPTSVFWFVTYKGQTGWASGHYLDHAPAASAPVLPTPPATGSTPAPTPATPAPTPATPAPTPAAPAPPPAATTPPATPLSTPSTPSVRASTCMSRLATVSTRMEGSAPRHECYHFVKEHLGSTTGKGFGGVQTMLGAPYQLAAYDFARWVDANPNGKATSEGFVEVKSPNLDALPKGAILVWKPGQCGYNAKYGHIEVNVGAGRACSDFCGKIKRTCGAPRVFVLQKDCN